MPRRTFSIPSLSDKNGLVTSGTQGSIKTLRTNTRASHNKTDSQRETGPYRRLGALGNGPIGECGTWLGHSRRAASLFFSAALPICNGYGEGDSVTAVGQEFRALSPPGTADLQRTARDTLDVIRKAHEQLHHDMAALAKRQQGLGQEREDMLASRRSLEMLSDELDAKQDEQKAQLAELNKDLAKIATSAAAAETGRQELERDHQAVEAQRLELTEAQRRQVQAAETLGERERAVQEEESKVIRQAEELAPLRNALDQRQLDMQAQSEQLESLDAELSEKHRMLATLQEQLVHEQQQIADQRRIMFERLGTENQVASGDTTAPVPAKGAPDQTGVTQPVESVAQAPVTAPQPPAGGKADQFRKLRRDAKRRAIGV